MNREKIKSIVIICLSIVVIVLLICMLFVKNNKYYKYYDDDLIEINNSGGFKVNSNIIYNQTLGVLLSANDKTSKIGKVKVTFYNKKGKEIFSDSMSRTVYGGSATMFTFNLPLLEDNDYAGTIKIDIDKESMENNKTNVAIDNINQVIKKNIDSDNNLSVKATLTNNNSADLSVLGGDIVALKDGKIVAFSSFYQENVKVNDSFNVEAKFPPYNFNQAFEYDDLKLYITSIADTAV